MHALAYSRQSPLLAVIAVILIVAGFLLWLFQVYKARRMIKESLEKQGFQLLEIHYVWLDFDRNNLTFNVEFFRPDGTLSETSCKVGVFGPFITGIYWKNLEG